MRKVSKFLLLAWFLIAIDPRAGDIGGPLPEKPPLFMGKFDDFIQCNTMADLLRIARPGWLVMCGYTIHDFKPVPFLQDGK